MKKAIFRFFLSVTLLFLLCQKQTFAQPSFPGEKPAFPYFFLGGSPTLSFGTITYVDVTVYAGYQISERFSFAAGPLYTYYKNKLSVPDFSTNIYGGRLFSSFIILKESNEWLPIKFGGDIEIKAELETLSLKRKHFDYINNYPESGRFVQNNIWIGGGYSSRIKGKTRLFLSVLWNINETLNTVYSSPQVRYGILFGL
jgi:hypothetical protein